MANPIVDPFDSTYQTQPEPTTDPRAQRRSQINDAYRKYLGRDADATGYDAWEANDDFESGIAGSAEAQAYKRKQGGASSWDEGAFRSGWEGGGYKNVDDLTNYINQGGWGNHVQQVGSKRDKIRLPDGRVIDAVLAAGAGGRGAQWLDESQGGGSGGPIDGGGMLPPTGGGFGAGSKWDELYNILMTRAKQGTAIDPNDPNIKQQVEPYAAAQERQRRNYLADLAEQGGPNANLRGESRLAMERAGQATGEFQGQLIGRELTARRQEIQDALNGAQGMLSQEQQQALQRELAQMDNAIRKYGIDVQNSQFGRSLAEQGRQFNNTFGQRIGESEMEFWLRSQGL